ncbi:unnamed protein product [Symbiodinium microadriaticum]|nr:unnamed protein product [Symbiodinium sp. KB8]CAE7908143.1 unnamed protein product [Symbiodinium microadriaticum]
MPPQGNRNPATKGGGKQKGSKAEANQQSTVDFGLPPSVVTALQSISSRATQDLWTTTSFQADSLTAEQLAQRRSNNAGKLSKRITGDTKAKQELSLALSDWLSQIGQHLLGLVGRIRAISSKLDEDLSTAIQEMQQYLVGQPSSVTEEQIAAAMNQLPRRCFDGRSGDCGGTCCHHHWTEVEAQKCAASGARVTKSPRREPTPLASPWVTPATGMTPEGIRRVPQMDIAGDEPELLPAVPSAGAPTTPGTGWFQYWLQLASFAVENGSDPVGELCTDEAQEAILPLPSVEGDPEEACQLAERTWQALQTIVREKTEQHMLPMCLALNQTLQVRGLLSHPCPFESDMGTEQPVSEGTSTIVAPTQATINQQDGSIDAMPEEMPHSLFWKHIRDMSPAFYTDTSLGVCVWALEYSGYVPLRWSEDVSDLAGRNPDHLQAPGQSPGPSGNVTPPAAFEALLTTAGHETGDALFTAYDTLGTTLELLSVPFGPVRWWIVRDGLGRELLRSRLFPLQNRRLFLPAPEVAPWVTQDPALLPAWGQDHDHEEDTADEGDEWDSTQLTFTGSFSASYPGQVHILIEQEDRTLATVADATCTREELAEAQVLLRDPGRLSKVLLSIGLLTSGRYDWRTPEPLRICDATVTQGISAVLMSPFSGRSDCFPISHSTAISEIRDNICQDEPPWYADIAPVWPSISRASLVFVPVPIDSSLVVIVIAVVTADWQAAFLIPSFTTLDWLLAREGDIVFQRDPIPVRDPCSGSPSPLFANVLVVGPPAPTAILIPSRLQKRRLFAVLCSYFPGTAVISGQIQNLADHIPPTADIILRDGDVITTHGSGWSPSIHYVAPDSFVNHASARSQGRWSHPLSFYSDCWVLLWSPDVDSPTAIYAEGRQTWDPAARTLIPALQHLPNGWWPSPRGGPDITEPLHLVETSGEICRANILHWNQPRCCQVMMTGLPRYRDGDVLTAPDTAKPRTAQSRHPQTGPDSRGHAAQPASAGLVIALLISLAFGIPGTVGPPRAGYPWALAILACYLAAKGSTGNCTTTDQRDACWELDMTAPARLTADLHQYWWSRPLHQHLPCEAPMQARFAWDSFPQSSGGVPSSLFIATDGSGTGNGSWAFLAWGLFSNRWHKIRSATAPLPDTPWVPPGESTSAPQLASFQGELAALESAGLWVSAMLDMWYLHMRARPALVTIAVDNASALQVAAGHGQANIPLARLTRQACQSAQARINTRFCHVHSHTGLLANSLADALATLAAHRHPLCRIGPHAVALTPEDFQHHFARLWLVPTCTLSHGTPIIKVPKLAEAPKQPEPLEPTVPQDQEAAPVATQPLSIHVITANVQTIKDAPISVFNPSGLAARRQYLYLQAKQCSADIICLQETRSAAGRWKGPGLLTWRSGALKGQYGCEIWVRPAAADPALTLQDWRIIAASPRLIAVTCLAARFPVTVICAHAPHSDRPDGEARDFWQELTAITRRAPPHRALVIGVDANGDLHSSDEEQALIGDLTAATEVARNDELLLEFCLINGLEAPATFSDIQRSPSWTWQHTSGRQKRLDHILYRPGPWRHTLAAQALDFDIVNGARDHVAMRVRSDLTCPRPPAKTTPRRRASREEIVGFGNEVWSRVTATAGEWNHPEASVEALHRHYNKAMQNLPPRPIAHVVQPYLHPHTIHHLLYLRDWRSQVRTLQRGLRLILLRAVWQAWRGTDPVPHFTIYQHRLVLGAYVLHEHRLQSKVHGLARKDKIRQFTHLTRRAVDDWHRTGQPIQAVAHLRWASKRSADRRSVHAAGGYDIDAELEEQFRAQEGGLRMSPRQLQDRINAWTSRAAPPCKGALPTLLDLEQCCLRQKDGKAPGPDQIPNELYRHFPAYAGRWLWKVCAYAALSGHEPKQFRGALQCALYKRGPASMPSNYRSIALLNGAAKMWHSHIRGTVGARLLQHYDPFQLGGRKHIPVAFAAAKFRTVWDLCTQQGRCAFALFIDIQAAYYETSRQLLFHGDASLPSYEDWRLQHLAQLTEELARNGALALLGTPDEETALLLDCVSCSHWHMVGSSNLFLATRGSRPGDGLADILFGGLFSIALRHIRRACAAEGLAHTSAGTYIGRPAEIIPVGWADDLAILADFPDPSSLKACAPRVADIAIATLEHLRFRVNLGPGKTEAMMDIRGPEAKKVRGELLTGASELQLPDGRAVRISAEYRYLGVIQQPRDTGRRDQELALKRAQAAWAHARGLVTSASLPWELRHAWIASRVLPAAYATLATSTAVSGRAKAPLEGFFERATRALAASWQHGHVLSKPTLYSVACLTAPDVATTVARARLVTQLCRNSPEPVWEVFEAGWSRATTLCGLLTDACQQVLPAIHQLRDHSHVTLPLIQQHSRLFHKACQHLSRHGTVYRTFWDLWRDVAEPRSKKILGAPGCFLCALCSQTFPSRHALAAHIHRRHSVVNSLTLYTAGTICLWCHVDHHSTDRLKYHLKHSHRCMHGLRVTVGQAYTYGSGTKRKGAQGHRGLPPTPLPGPVNATPAQRLAALESREATSHELQAELFRATGVTDVYAWPANPPTEVLSDTHHDDVVTGLAYAASTVPVEPPERFACRLLVDAFAESSGAFPSPFWPGLANETVCWGLPSGWHRWWRLWLSADTVTDPWSFLARAAQRPLRPAPGSGMAHHSTFLQKLCANTIAFRQICLQVQHKGLLWIHGVPSTAGLALLRRVLPRASFRTVQSDAGVIFVAAHSQDFVSKALASLISVSMREPRAPPCTVSGGLFLQPPLVYRTRSLAGAS